MSERRCAMFPAATGPMRTLAAWLAIAISIGGAAWGGTEPSFEIFPGVVVDGQLILVMKPASGISVIDAQAGHELCSTGHASRPLLMHGNRLLAQVDGGGNVLGLRLFELRQARAVSKNGACELRLLDRIDVRLPPGVHTAIEHSVDDAFDLRARSEGAEVLVEWTYRNSPAFPPHMGLGGAFRIDLGSTVVTLMTQVPASRDSMTRVLPPIPAEAIELPTVAGAATLRVFRRGDATTGLELTSPGGRNTELDVSDLRSLRLSADDRHLLATSRDPSGGSALYRWSIFDVVSGEPSGVFWAPRSGPPFVVQAGRILYREENRPADGNPMVRRERRLMAGDLTNGQELWSVAVRDIRYRGTRPPAQPFPAPGGGQ